MQEENNGRLPRLLFTLLVVLGVQVSRADAQESAISYSIEKISVTDEADDSGQAVSMEKIKRSQARDLKDVFAAEPSVVVGGGAANAQRIYLRGIDGTNLNISVDGASQGRNNMSQHRAGIAGIDTDLLKRVEVQTGTSADSGPGALGGGISFETVDAQDLLSTGKNVGFMLKSGHATADESWRMSGSFYGLLGEGIGVLGHVSNRNSEDYRIGGGGVVPNSAGENTDYFVKLSILEKAGHSIRVSAERLSDSGLYLTGSTGSDMGYPPEGSTPVYQESERHTYVFDHRYRLPGSRLVDWRFNVYRNELAQKRPDTESETLSKRYGGTVKNTAAFELAGTSHSLTLGADYFTEDGLVYSGGVQSGGDNTATNLGLFVQERMSVGPVLLSLGGRFDSYDSEYGTEKLKGDKFSPNASVELKVLDGLTGFAGYGEAVRSTSVVPVSWLANGNAATQFNMNSGKDSYGKAFEPERSIRRDAGVRFEMNGLVCSDDRLEAQFTLFKTDLKNLIQQVGGQRGAPVTGFYNDDPIYANGWELRAGWSGGSYSTTFGYTHVDTKDKNGDPVAITRRVGASTGDRFVWDNRFQAASSVVLGYTMTAVGPIEEGTIDRAGYVLHDLQAEWSPKSLDGLTLSLAVNNLLDRKYTEQTSIESGGSAVHEPGRDFRMQAAYRF